jgi:hypothetical protein
VVENHDLAVQGHRGVTGCVGDGDEEMMGAVREGCRVELEVCV